MPKKIQHSSEEEIELAPNQNAQKVLDHFKAPGPEDVEAAKEDAGPLEFTELCEAELREFKAIAEEKKRLEKLYEKRKEDLLRHMGGDVQAVRGSFKVWVKKTPGGTKWKEMFIAIAGEPKPEDLEQFKGQDRTTVSVEDIT